VSAINFWTIRQIAEELDVTPEYLQLIIAGNYPLRTLNATKIAGRWLVEDVEAKRFIHEFKNPSYLTPQDIAKSIGKSRKYVLDQLTGYGGRKLPPRLKGEKKGDRWVIEKGEAERFIELHRKEGGSGG
jgi:hypothetical protein